MALQNCLVFPVYPSTWDVFKLNFRVTDDVQGQSCHHSQSVSQPVSQVSQVSQTDTFSCIYETMNELN